MAIPISASIIQINPETLFNDGFELTDQNMILEIGALLKILVQQH
jgi:hypothetical protein